MESTMKQIEEGYVRQGWKRVASSDGSISFEKAANPSIFARQSGRVEGSVVFVVPPAISGVAVSKKTRKNGSHIVIRRKAKTHSKKP
jgi:hypothetical protein